MKGIKHRKIAVSKAIFIGSIQAPILKFYQSQGTEPDLYGSVPCLHGAAVSRT